MKTRTAEAVSWIVLSAVAIGRYFRFRLTGGSVVLEVFLNEPRPSNDKRSFRTIPWVRGAGSFLQIVPRCDEGSLPSRRVVLMISAVNQTLAGAECQSKLQVSASASGGNTFRTAALQEVLSIRRETAMLAEIREELAAIVPCTCDRDPLGHCAQCDVDLSDADIWDDALNGALAALEESTRPATIAEFERAVFLARNPLPLRAASTQGSFMEAGQC